MLLKAGDVLGKLGDRDTGLHEDGSHRKPCIVFLFLESPSYSDISLSDVGSQRMFLFDGATFFGENCGAVAGRLFVLLSW